jgi:flagellar biosynthetic protein FlhB
MSEEDKDQKTEHPTGKRLGEARSRGQLPISREVTALVSLTAVVGIIGWVIPHTLNDMITVLRGFLEAPESISITSLNLQSLLFSLMAKMGFATFLIFSLMAFAVIFGVMAQTGPFASLELIKPKIENLNPMGGFKKLFSVNAGVEIIKSFFKMLLLGYAAYLTLKPLINDLTAMAGGHLMPTMEYLHHQAVHLLIILLLVFAFIAAADYYYQNWQYIKNLKMTKTEVKDEHKQMEGDPVVKQRLRQIRVDKARKRMMAQVPKADVVITNPTHYAVALQYDPQKMAAPVVLAKGTDRIAQRIREIADDNRVPLVSNPPLARSLYDNVEIDEQIPEQHYRTVAEIISYVYKLKKRTIS